MGTCGRLRGALVAACTVVVMLGATTACGSSESASDKAKSQVCDAKSDIQTQLNDLKSLTLSSATLDSVSQSVTAIQGDLKTIQDAIPDLDGDTKAQVQSANQQFKSQVTSTLGSVLTSTSIDDAQTQLQTALTSLEATYKQAYDSIKC